MSSPPRTLALIALLAPALCAHAAAPLNCDLAAPPANAGIDRHMGAVLKIYPRTPDIGPAYAGCQTLWAQSDDGWEPITVLHYAAGRVVRIDSPALPHDPIEQCLVKDGAVVRGDPDLCAQLDDMRIESLPADCADVADGGGKPDAQRAAQCARR